MGEELAVEIMKEVKRYDDGNGCTRRQLVDNILILISQSSRASVAAPRHYFCSCGGALTAEDYITHYFELGHDHATVGNV